MRWASIEIVILSAEDSGDLETWLRQHDYHIPDGADEALSPYVQGGMKFFVAKVDVEKVTFEDGRALLSPLRVHYQTPDFTLPIRLGMLNSAGTQDLIVHVLARNTRYEAASYDNTFVPTNLEVNDAVREDFGAFYAALFDEVIEAHPRAVVTEYAWQATNCDPCPGPVLSEADLMTLGADVATAAEGDEADSEPAATSMLWSTRVRLGSADAGAGLPGEVIQRIARRHANQLRFCHQSRLAGRPANEAEVEATIELTIDSSGATTDVRATAPGHDGLRDCMTAAVRRWRFPAPQGAETVHASMPVHFDAAPSNRGMYGGGLGYYGQTNPMQQFVLTRLHYRYGKGDSGRGSGAPAGSCGGRGPWRRPGERAPHRRHRSTCEQLPGSLHHPPPLGGSRRV